MAKNNDIEKKLEEFRAKEAEDFAELMAQKYGVPYLDLSRTTIDLDALKLVSQPDAEAGKMAVFQKTARRLRVGAFNPTLPKAKEILESLERKGYQLELSVVSEPSLKRAWSRYAEIAAFEEMTAGTLDISASRLEESIAKIKAIADFQELILPFTGASKIKNVSEVLEFILAGALALDASDVHLEPQEKAVAMRFRLDGVLSEVATFTAAAYALLLSRVKLTAGMKLNVKDRAQDGRFTIRTTQTEIEVRVSSLPGPYGETIVMRVLNPKTIALTLEDLGLHPELQKIVKKELKKPNGMILTTGPTGSGKTTTLYAFVKAVNEPGVKIITIEDPIEYHIPGISQTQVDASKGYTFANGLRSILRQDPDTILVGEIRDLETAEIAMHAALTGHLVFSTLHTNSAAGTIPRLIDLKADPAIIAPAINIAMAQRLVRRLCPHCKKETAPTADEKKLIEDALKKMPSKYKKDVKTKDLRVWKAGGCPKCSTLGYKGRIGIYEAFLVDDAVERLILKKPAEGDLREAMERQEMMTMMQDGILKALDGLTSMDELIRVAGLPT
ncbi:MAG: type II/IV secretion system protein [Candidatus Niyogibacteria bacterium]|nr:type II/IV secretion system protein [Candidatus Niyogibacteria bacterium]